MYAYVFIMELLCTYWVYSADGSPWVAGLADPPAGRGLGSEHCNHTFKQNIVSRQKNHYHSYQELVKISAYVLTGL